MSERTHEHYEPGGVTTSYVLLAAVGALLLLAGAIGGLYAIYAAWVPNPKPPAERTFPTPRLEAHPAAELHRLLARQHKEMNGYQWANSQHTLVAIPIDRAMELIAKRGDKAFAPVNAPKPIAGGPTPTPGPAAPPTVPKNRAAPAGQVKTPAQPQTPKTAPTPLSQHPGLGSGAQLGAKP
jgi:hypothetical protein